ncbi:hypothetical protein Htur_4603 (plasmid) [Haloterrigena turkmenica DSM 5511]|uniref:Uncharacterized protein n=1 Tax=Haloterrigena turkmenica (strain ATCC 51198 / DSM 5511 / JCM 9101 / NCIMB 13204 / VKM B-1734 / 4k) TaxID=543526 RepID=D2S1Z4_HALTV|nr:hypothetical protein Htur_4603 [Haloterrigena turkmenica DSM 5511]
MIAVLNPKLESGIASVGWAGDNCKVLTITIGHPIDVLPVLILSVLEMNDLLRPITAASGRTLYFFRYRTIYSSSSHPKQAPHA